MDAHTKSDSRFSNRAKRTFCLELGSSHWTFRICVRQTSRLLLSHDVVVCDEMTRAVEELVVASWLAIVRYPCQASREREVSRLHYGAFCSLRVCALWSPTHRLVCLNNNRHYEHITLRLRGGCLCPPFNAPSSLKEVDFAARRHCGARHKTHREIREKSWSASWFMMMDSVCVCVAAQSNDMEERLSQVLWLCNSVADSLFRAEQQNLKRRLSNSPVFLFFVFGLLLLFDLYI